jgi:CBS domain-containing protein
MTGVVKTANESQTVKEVAKIMIDNDIGSVVITSGDALAGIITEKDIVRVVGAARPITLQTPVRDIMSRPVITINAQSSLKDAIQTMQIKSIRRLPVIDYNKKMIGIITDSDIFRAIMKSQSLITTVSESVLVEYKPIYDRLAEVMLGEILLPGGR